MEHSVLVRVKKIKGKGRGVVARCPIKKGTVIERVPVMFVPVELVTTAVKSGLLEQYFYEWDDEYVAMSLGYGSIYNHSYTPNAVYSHGTNTLTYRALCDIEEGEEITVNYNWHPKDKQPMGFKVV